MEKRQDKRIATRRMARELTPDQMKELKGGGLTPWYDPQGNLKWDGVYN